MKRLIFTCTLFMLMLSGCSGWTVEPLPYVSPSSYPSPTPVILSATPIILPLPVTATVDTTPSASSTASTSATPTSTFTQTVTPAPSFTSTTFLPSTFTPTLGSTPFPAVQTKILGCSNGLDVTHGMGEVTNAYITIQNTGTVDLTNVCATLNMLREGRPHPEKTRCISLLPAGYQVTVKLTVDSTLGKDSPVQVDVNSGASLLQRAAQNSCSDFSLFAQKINNLGTVTPIPTP